MKIIPVTIRIGKAVSSRIRNSFYRLLGVKIVRYVELRKIEIPRNWNQISITGPSCLDRGVTLLATGDSTPEPKIEIGGGVYINRNTIIDSHQSIVIGKHSMIGPNCYITDGNHGTHATTRIVDQPMICSPVHIGSGAWLGANVSVLKGVSIGEGAVIGAGSVVTKDIPPFAIAAGVPARQIGVRNQTSEPEQPNLNEQVAFVNSESSDEHQLDHTAKASINTKPKAMAK